jgi:hypothetical protein
MELQKIWSRILNQSFIKEILKPQEMSPLGKGHAT